MSPLFVKTLTVGRMQTNCYLLIDAASKETVIVDPGDDSEYIADAIQTMKLSPVLMVATHGHFDHLMAAFALQNAFNIPFKMHKNDVFLVNRMSDSARHFLGIPFVDPAPTVSGWLSQGRKERVGESSVDVLEVPGHTPGSIALYQKAAQMLFVGDIIFSDGYVGRTDFSYGNASELSRSIQRLLSYPPDTTVYPGHGAAFFMREARLKDKV